jgi:hypothetical protein
MFNLVKGYKQCRLGLWQHMLRCQEQLEDRQVLARCYSSRWPLILHAFAKGLHDKLFVVRVKGKVFKKVV